VRLIGLGGWLITILASAFVAQNYENWAERRGISDIFGPTAPDASQSFGMTVLASVAQWAVAAADHIAGPFGLGFTIAAILFSIPDMRSAMRRYGERRLNNAALDGLTGLRHTQIKMAHQAIENFIKTMLHHKKTSASQQPIHAFNVAHHCLKELQNWLALKLDIALNSNGQPPTYATAAKALDAYIAAYYPLQEVALPIYQDMLSNEHVKEAARHFIECDGDMIQGVLRFTNRPELRFVYERAYAIGKASSRFHV